LEFGRTTWPSSLCLGYCFLSKNFTHIAKAASIVHLKLGGSYKPSYFPTSTSHLHDWHIASAWFLIWKNTSDSLQAIFLSKNSLTLQRLQASSILNWVVAISLAICQLPPPISTTDLLQALGFWYGKIRVTHYKRSIFDMDRFWHLVWANWTSWKVSLFIFRISFYIFLMYGVCINQVLQGCINFGFFFLAFVPPLLLHRFSMHLPIQVS
jgi:hypothetical protein